MTSESCRIIAGLLVDYADGELAEADARRVAAHLAACADCRGELRLLGRSLELARLLWHQSAARARVPGPCSTGPRRRRIPVAACLAACVAVLLLAVGPWLFSRIGPRRGMPSHGAAGQSLPPPPEDTDVEDLIAREGRSARLAAAARLLATQPGLEDYRDQAYRYMAEAYRETAAVAQAAAPPAQPPTKEPQ
jgi:hypothetical protein